jgi:hypothetical protein
MTGAAFCIPQSIAERRCRLGFLSDAGIDAPRSGASEDEIKEYEAKKNRGIAAIENRENALGSVHHPIADRHFA